MALKVLLQILFDDHRLSPNPDDGNLAEFHLVTHRRLADPSQLPSLLQGVFPGLNQAEGMATS